MPFLQLVFAQDGGVQAGPGTWLDLPLTVTVDPVFAWGTDLPGVVVTNQGATVALDTTVTNQATVIIDSTLGYTVTVD